MVDGRDVWIAFRREAAGREKVLGIGVDEAAARRICEVDAGEPLDEDDFEIDYRVGRATVQR